MKSSVKFVAVDLGASGGRLMAGLWDGERFALEDLHRFPNGGVTVGSNLYWDMAAIWTNLQSGLKEYRARFSDLPAGIGVDSWGVDFGLLNKAGHLIENPFHYRDKRTDGIPALAFELIPDRDIFSATGIQTMQFNTLYQLYSMVRSHHRALYEADRLLMIPDLCSYFLCGDKRAEYTEATTTQLYSAFAGDWEHSVVKALDIPAAILPPVIKPGTMLAPLRSQVLEECGFGLPFPAIAVASHDTASAVAAIPSMEAESVFISSGTWSLMGVELDAPNVSDESYRLGFTNEGGADGSTLLMKNITGLWIIQECMRHWKSQGQNHSWDDLQTAASLATPFKCLIDSNARDFQMPCDMPDAIRHYCHATHQPVPETVGEIARCAFESLSLKYRSVLDSLTSLTGRAFCTLRVMGGGSLNTMLCQMTADACDAQVVCGPVEASALGNVMMQAVATGHLPSIAAGRAAISASIQSRSFEPHRSDAWDTAYARFKQLEST
jgi:rhamnulokinase